MDLHVTTHDHSHSHNHNHSHVTPAKIIRKLSHSKIIVHHLPHLIKGEQGDPIFSSTGEEDVEKSSGSEAPEDPPPQIKVKKDLPTRLRGLPGGRFLGLFLALMASLTMSLMALVAKSMSQYHAFSLVLWRLQGVLLPSLGFMACFGSRLGVTEKAQKGESGKASTLTSTRWMVIVLLVARGFFGCSADVFQFASLKFLSLADSSVVAFSTPIFVTFVAYFLLGERLGVVPILTAVTTLVGVIIISRPPMLTGEEAFDDNILIGNALALGCMLMSTLTIVSLRTLRNTHFSLTTFSYSFIGTLESLVLCAVTSTFELPSGLRDWALAVALAIACLLGQVFFTLALQLEDAGPVSLVRSCDLVFAFFWQYLFLNVVPDVYSIIGGSIVITGVLVTGLRKFVQELPPTNVTRQRFWFLLK